MVMFRKWTILLHRWLGIALSLLFVVWFVSGIAIMYARGMPSLTPELRLQRLPPLDLTRVGLTPADAAKEAFGNIHPDRAVLLTIMDRPAYRFSSFGSVTIFADNGEFLEEFRPVDAMKIAGTFTGLAEDKLQYAGVLSQADQWTIGLRRQLPLHKITVDDTARTELYVSESLGEVVLLTTRGSRALAWVAAIPHWLYFAPLRLNDELWRRVVLWASGVGCILALLGIILGILQFSPSRPFRLKRINSYIPYSGWMRWHYITGILFGIFTLTWVFSGMLSMEPWGWAQSRTDFGEGLYEALSGGPLDMSLFSHIDPAEWERNVPRAGIKEIEFLRIQGGAHYTARTGAGERLLLSANPLQVQHDAFPVESVMARVKQAIPDVSIVESTVLHEYDSYYYSAGQARPLPVLRLKFDDPERTWFYIDPRMSRVVARAHRLRRLERWLYNGLHSLDFSFWYNSRPLWDIGMIVLSIGGILSSGIGLFLGTKRIYRKLAARSRG